MKKGIIAISILCTGLLLLDPVKNMSFASMDNKVNTNIVNLEENDKDENKIDDKELHNENSTINENEENNKEEVTKDESTKEESNKEEISKEEVTKPEVVDNENEESNKEEVEEGKVEQENEVLSKEEAEELLLNINPELEYLYQGDENTFSALKEKNLSGYVFLPNVDGDMGYFVDQTNSDVYFFHPSGYLELVK